MKIEIDKETWFHIMELAKERSSETCGLAMFREINGAIHVSNFVIAEVLEGFDNYENDLSTAGSTVVNPKVLSQHRKLCKELKYEGLVWIHSHCHFGVFWSSTDERCIKNFPGHKRLLSIVVNKAKNFMIRMDTAFLSKIETININTIHVLDTELSNERMEQITKECKETEEQWKEKQNKWRPTETSKVHFRVSTPDRVAYWESIFNQSPSLEQEESDLQLHLL
jgi:hypothetical protein